MNDKYMKLALALASKAEGQTSPNPLVGAVIVKNDKIIGTGYHQKAGTAHAEIHALREAGELARGSDLYVTLEPCNHTGRTPPCTKAIIEAGIKSVFVAVRDPNPLVAGQGIAKLKEHGIKVSEGIMELEASRLNEVFFKYIQTKIPYIALKSALSLDGKTATQFQESQWITGEEARLHGHSLRNKYDAILVGIGTVLADNPRLTCRLGNKNQKDPARIIIDSRLSIPISANVLQNNSSAPTIIATTGCAPASKINEIEKIAQVLIVNDSPPVDLTILMQMLGKLEITSLLVEGGARINGSFLRSRLIDKCYFYFAPKIIGGQTAPGVFAGEGILSLDSVPSLENMSLVPLGTDLLITGYPHWKEGL